MIRRLAGEQFWLVSQNDHARFAGVIAACIGGQFALPDPREAVLDAVSSHDAGWPSHDDAPTLNSKGQPLNVFEISMGLATKVWASSAERAKAKGFYTALLVSIHQLHLSHYATQDGPFPHERAKSSADQFTLNKFQHQQVELQESLRRELQLRTDLPLHFGLAARGTGPAEDALSYHYGLLSLCDRLSLQLCMGRLLFPQMDDVSPAPGAEPVKMTTQMIDDHTVSVDPWPFATGPFDVKVPYRAVSGKPFANEAALRAAYQKSPVEKTQLSLRPSGEQAASP